MGGGGGLARLNGSPGNIMGSTHSPRHPIPCFQGDNFQASDCILHFGTEGIFPCTLGGRGSTTDSHPEGSHFPPWRRGGGVENALPPICPGGAAFRKKKKKKKKKPLVWTLPLFDRLLKKSSGEHQEA